MESEQLNRLLVDRFPNLREKYLDEVGWQEGDSTGSHTVYGDVLTPYLVECIVNDTRLEIQKVFDFVEEILSIKDRYSEEVIFCSVIESVAYLFDGRDYLRSYLGRLTKNAINELLA